LPDLIKTKVENPFLIRDLLNLINIKIVFIYFKVEKSLKKIA